MCIRDRFKSWAEIKNEEVYTISNNNYNAGVNFKFYFDGGEESVFLESLAIPEGEFRTLIQTYRQNSVKLHPEIYTEYKNRDQSDHQHFHTSDLLSEAQKKYLTKRRKLSRFTKTYVIEKHE